MPVTRVVALALAFVLAACSSQQAATNANGPIAVVTTISTFNSMVQAVGGNRVQVKSLVPVGASPETYQPTPQDVATLSQAALLVENGAGLETWLGKTIANVGSHTLRTVVCSNGLTVQNQNPHLWMDPVNAKHYVFAIRDGLINIDPQHGEEYRTNARHYAASLDKLQASIARRIATIPPSHRYMIVFHNAWLYYNERFGITSLGFIEANPGQDPNPQQIAQLIELARAHQVRAIFSEPEYSAKIAQQIAHNANIKVVDNLYDDSIGTDPQVSTYTGMLNYDTDVIVKALQ
ncbi:MAG: zinc ABC transporter substrate-binding protein [Candidatus Eremiobacteraeota bacterium]|nr:zinc ABC transporter substrate-binding protein [Candidatus Eremiobacteraeota bacterium]